MENTNENEQIEATHKELVLKLLFSDGKSVFTKKEAQSKVSYLLDMLTDSQQKELCKKVERCNYYQSKVLVGLPTKRIRMLVRRKFDINKFKVSQTCEPCEAAVANLTK